tara:strand:- start:1128 stop:1970 length:843 start_codon:yes stop_codon:yes gene_type:complete
MNYKNGYSIKPKHITQTGEVIFTDGTNEVRANQITCQDYGYTYNESTGTCSAFKYNTKINNTSDNVHNIIKGNLNTTNLGTENSFLLGADNKSEGDNLNVMITGSKNVVDKDLKNTSIISGTFGQAKNQGEVLMAGGGFGSTLALAQTFFVQQSGITTDNTETSLYTQYITNKFIEKVKNSVIGFEANVIGINYGGEGEVGEYGYVQVTGAVKFTNGLASTYHQSTTHIVESGHSGMNITAVMKDATATSFGVAVTGLAETRIQWTAEVKLWQNKLTQTF